MSAPAGSINQATYEYEGAATQLYLYSANSGINIYGIQLSYPSTPTDIDHIQKPSAAHKVLRNGQVVVVRESKTYNLLGTRID